MASEISLNTPLADALTAVIQPKLMEVGWGSGGPDDSALAEYIVLMLVNGKSQEQIASELSGDLLNLGPDDPGAREFSRWLFEQIDTISAQLRGEQPPQAIAMAEASQNQVAPGDQDTDMTVTGDVSELNAPTGPRSMRNGNNMRGGREKRMLGHMAKAMDRSQDAALHRVRGQTGNERISRTPPTGPRMGQGRLPRNVNNRGAGIQAGLAGMGGMHGPHGGMPGMTGMDGNWSMSGQQQMPTQMELYALLEQQKQMMQQLSQQMMNSRGSGGGNFGNQRHGKSLFDRVQAPNRSSYRRDHQQANGGASHSGEEAKSGDGEDVEMTQAKREPPNPDDTVCKYNLKCTNKDCKFAHQSPAAPPGVAIDVNDICTFGAACKNRKCVGRHPSPAARLAHQSEQDCKFYPNCQNPRCPFKHPMPFCRNGPDCTTPNCKFTHTKTKCKFNPCLNPNCRFAHDDGQQGGFKDKVWTAESQDHVSERKFVDEKAEEEAIVADADTMVPEQPGVGEVIG